MTLTRESTRAALLDELNRLLVDAHGVPDDERERWAARLAKVATAEQAAEVERQRALSGTFLDLVDDFYEQWMGGSMETVDALDLLHRNAATFRAALATTPVAPEEATR